MNWMIIILCFFLNSALSQNILPEVIGTAGSRATGTNTLIDWTMGEVAVTTVTSSNNIVSQGFHQPYLSILPTSIIKKPLIEVKVFPNPTSKQVHLISKEIIPPKSSLYLSNSEGKKLIELKLESGQNQWIIDLNQYPIGQYILTLEIASNSILQSYKIIKTK